LTIEGRVHGKANRKYKYDLSCTAPDSLWYWVMEVEGGGVGAEKERHKGVIKISAVNRKYIHRFSKGRGFTSVPAVPRSIFEAL
jgi:hypothetical protein